MVALPSFGKERVFRKRKVQPLDTARHAPIEPSVTPRPYENLSKPSLNTNTQIHILF